MVATIPTLAFDDPTVPSEQQFEMQHDTIAPMWDIAPLDDVGSFGITATDYLVDDLVVSRVEQSPHTMRRTAAHLDDTTDEWVSVQLVLSGNFTGHVAEQPVHFDPGRIGVIDLAEPFSAWTGQTDAIWIAVPRSRLAHVDDRYGHHPLRTLSRSSRRGMVLGAVIEHLWERLATAPADQAGDIAAAMVDTLDLALRTDRYTPSDDDLLTAMEAFVAANLDHPDLGATVLQHVFHCSRATLYRVFKPHGGVETYIREQRLVRCFDELSQPGHPTPAVGTVALRWGFDNPSHFHRLFVQMFGMPPSSLTRRPPFERTGAALPTDLTDAGAQFQDWFEARA